jgi:hypothetical protein
MSKNASAGNGALPRRPLAQRVEVAGKEVSIMGSKSEFLRTLISASSGGLRR